MMGMNRMVKKKTGETVLISGATGGIGREIASRFAEEGWNVICHYFSSDEKAEELKKLIEGCNVKCSLIKADFLKKADVEELIGKLSGYNIDSLINNAGTNIISKHFSELTFNDIAGTFAVNAFAPMLLTANIFIKMKDRRFGRIVNISSIAAKYGGSSYSMHYGSSKCALEGMAKTLAKEGAEHDVLVNTIRPGVIDTDFHKKFPKDMTKRIGMIPAKRMGIPKDIADMVYYLGSEKNNFITNEVITIAGGE